MIENRLRWLLLKIGLWQWKIKAVSAVSCAMSKAFDWYYPKPGSKSMANWSIAIASKVDKLGYDVAEYEDKLENLTMPISEAKKLFTRSHHVSYAATEHKQLTMLVMHRQFRVPKAQLARMLESKR